ncbi:glycine-rich protein [Quillaja saponaria]|nr:glycine-rich protein [Quillaja saponaria]
MSTIQVTASRPRICVKNIYQLQHVPSKQCTFPHNANPLSTTSLSISAIPPVHLKYGPISKSLQWMPVCFAGGKGLGESDNEGSPWKALEKAMGKFKGEKSIEDMLRQQIEKGDYYDDGGSGKKPPQGGSGGNGSNGPEDESFAGIVDETLQVVLATIGFIFLYIYIISGEELTRLAKDYIKYLFSGNKSVRLSLTMYKWGQFYKKLTEKKVVDNYWLEKEIINTPTWWDDPEKYRRSVRNY